MLGAAGLWIGLHKIPAAGLLAALFSVAVVCLCIYFRIGVIFSSKFFAALRIPLGTVHELQVLVEATTLHASVSSLLPWQCQHTWGSLASEVRPWERWPQNYRPMGTCGSGAVFLGLARCWHCALCGSEVNYAQSCPDCLGTGQDMNVTCQKNMRALEKLPLQRKHQVGPRGWKLSAKK